MVLIDVIEVPHGLKNVIVTDTSLGDVRGTEGFYHYRQYSAIDLALHRSFEDVWFLFFDGDLPAEPERDRFVAEIAPFRNLPEELLPMLRPIAMAGSEFRPLDGLRTALSLTSTVRGVRPLLDADPAERRADAMFVCAVTPTILTALHRLRRGEEPVSPRDDLPYAANYLYMLTGREPQPHHARALERYLISTIDHGFNASTFTGRVIASTGADLASCVIGAIGALSGPLHGGAPSRALEALEEIGTPERVDDYVRPRIKSGQRIMGFGHPVYRTEDPRSRMLRETAEELGGDLVDFAKHVERRVLELLVELKPGRELHTNVEFYGGVVMELCGLPPEMFTPTFASSRVVGWCANFLEQATDSKIIRPSARYVGPPPGPVPTASNGGSR